MDLAKRVKMLEIAYAGVQADAVRWFNNEGLLEKITEQKKKEQLALGKQQAERFGIQKTEDVFIRLSEIFNCASWEISKEGNCLTAVARACRLCALAKTMSQASPCYIYCLNPMEGMIKGIKPDSLFDVRETLWNGTECRILVRFP